MRARARTRLARWRPSAARAALPAAARARRPEPPPSPPAAAAGPSYGRPTVAYIFAARELTARTPLGRLTALTHLLNAALAAAHLPWLVERAKKCLDFVATAYHLAPHLLRRIRRLPHGAHLVRGGGWRRRLRGPGGLLPTGRGACASLGRGGACAPHGAAPAPRPPRRWGVNVGGFIVTALLGEWLCVRRELQEIPLASRAGHPARKVSGMPLPTEDPDDGAPPPPRARARGVAGAPPPAVSQRPAAAAAAAAGGGGGGAVQLSVLGGGAGGGGGGGGGASGSGTGPGGGGIAAAAERALGGAGGGSGREPGHGTPASRPSFTAGSLTMQRQAAKGMARAASASNLGPE